MLTRKCSTISLWKFRCSKTNCCDFCESNCYRITYWMLYSTLPTEAGRKYFTNFPHLIVALIRRKIVLAINMCKTCCLATLTSTSSSFIKITIIFSFFLCGYFEVSGFPFSLPGVVTSNALFLQTQMWKGHVQFTFCRCSPHIELVGVSLIVWVTNFYFIEPLSSFPLWNFSWLLKVYCCLFSLDNRCYILLS